jgi:hypothetical protein
VIRPRGQDAPSAARRRRPAVRPDQRVLVARREVPGIQPG